MADNDRSQSTPEPIETVVRSWSAGDPTITQEGVAPDAGGWRITAEGKRTVRLFEVPAGPVDEGTVLYRARIRSENLSGRAYLEMWCRLPDGREYFARGLPHAVRGTTDWSLVETPFLLQKGQRPDLVKLNVVVEGKGTVWVKDVQLLMAGSDVAQRAIEQKGGRLASPAGTACDPLVFQRAFLPYMIVWIVGMFLLVGALQLLVPYVEGRTSQRTLFGVPLFRAQAAQEQGVTTGVVAVGGIAIGVISFGGLAIGLVAIGGGAVGFFAIGGGAVGIVASGGGAVGVIAIGGGAVGYIAIGGGAFGVYALGGGAFGRHVFRADRQDPEAVRVFAKYLPRLSACVMG